MVSASPILSASNISELLQKHTLREALEVVDQTLRRKPDAQGHLLRFDLLCLLEDWDRAMRQAENGVRFDASLLPLATLNMTLVNCERERTCVFAGTASPAIFPYVAPNTETAPEAATELAVNQDAPYCNAAGKSSTQDQPPAWIRDQLRALHLWAAGEMHASDVLREHALSQAPETAGHYDGKAFAWISDSDTRLGPVLEVFIHDIYTWIPFSHITSLELAQPANLRDLVWMPARIKTADKLLHAWIPGRYPGSVQAGDSLALGRETRWQNEGKSGVFGLGQKVLMTNAGDVSLYDLRTITFTPHQLSAPVLEVW